MDKKQLRKHIRELKNEVSLAEKIDRSRCIMQQLEQLPQFVEAPIVLTYWSMDDEVFTHEFVERWHREKTILLPCVDGDDLRLRQYTGPESLREGPQFGIPEPVGVEFTALDNISLIIVPGVAFDRQNNRMGRGRGFYDRLLKSTTKAYKVGVAFRFQLFDKIPVEPFDVPMNQVVSEPK